MPSACGPFNSCLVSYWKVNPIAGQASAAQGDNYLREDFDARPLSVIVGGGGWSKSYQNHSARVAAQAGLVQRIGVRDRARLFE